MKTRKKIRVAADISAATMLITSATLVLILAPEVGIIASGPMIAGALAAINDARVTTGRNPHRFFRRNRGGNDGHQVPRPQPGSN